MLPISKINPFEASHLPMQAWLDMLRVVLPIRCVLVVGAGLGNGPWVQWLKDRRVSTVHLVEGDERQYRHLTGSLLPIDGWTSWRDVIAASTEPVTFYQASNPAESGLVDPETLHQFWPHLETERSITTDSATTLDSLGAETGLAVNWLILDCLPASELLQGGIKLLSKIDVALVRVVQGEGGTLKTARHDAVDSVLRAAGLTCCHVQPERHPALAYALYVRDAGHQTHIAQERLQQANEQLRQRNQELECAKTVLEQDKQACKNELDAQTCLAEECRREIEELKRTKVKLEHEKAALVKPKQTSIGSGSRGDADIDDLIIDLEFFFNGKKIVYVDVGAYVGDVFFKIKKSIKKFDICEAHLFEPNPDSYAKLTKKVNKLNNCIVHTYNLAIGESNEDHHFVPARSMTKMLSKDVLPDVGPNDVFTAHCVTLDSQSAIFTDGNINLLKIDVEGKEMEVLLGACQLLKSQRVDILYIEVGFNRSGTQQTYFVKIDEFLQKFGYRVLRIYEQKEEWMAGLPLLRRANIAYMSEKFAKGHPMKLLKELYELKDQFNSPVKL